MQYALLIRQMIETYIQLIEPGESNGRTVFITNIIDQKLSDVEDCRFKKSILIGNVNKFIGNHRIA